MNDICRTTGLWTFLTERAARDFRHAQHAHGTVNRCRTCKGWHWARRERPQKATT